MFSCDSNCCYCLIRFSLSRRTSCSVRAGAVICDQVFARQASAEHADLVVLAGLREDEPSFPKGHQFSTRAGGRQEGLSFFASLKRLLIATKTTALRRNLRPRASFSFAGFQVTLLAGFG